MAAPLIAALGSAMARAGAAVAARGAVGGRVIQGMGGAQNARAFTRQLAGTGSFAPAEATGAAGRKPPIRRLAAAAPLPPILPRHKRREDDEPAESMDRAGIAARRLAAATMGVVAVFIPLVKRLHNFAATTLENQESLKKYNATIAGAFAQLEIDRLRRDIRTAYATRGSVSALARQHTVTEEMWAQPGRDLATMRNFLAQVASQLSAIVAMGIAHLPFMHGVLEKYEAYLLEQQGKRDADMFRALGDLRDLTQASWKPYKNPPPGATPWERVTKKP